MCDCVREYVRICLLAGMIVCACVRVRNCSDQGRIIINSAYSLSIIYALSLRKTPPFNIERCPG